MAGNVKKSKKKKKKGLEFQELTQWLLITVFFVALPTALLYGWINTSLTDTYYLFNRIPVDLGEGIAVLVIAIWSMVTATWIIPKYRSD